MKRVNKDEIRQMLDFGKWSRVREELVVGVRNEVIMTALAEGYDVLVDDTNFHPSHERDIRRLASDVEGVLSLTRDEKTVVTVEILDVDTPVEKSIKQDLQRERSVGKDVIVRMYAEKHKDRQPKRDNSLPPAVIFDIDGTVAEMADRGPYDWHRVGEDTPKLEILSMAQAMRSAGYSIIFVSGRDGSAWEDTWEWLDKHFGGTFSMLMRKTGDNRKDAIVKREIYMTWIRHFFYVSLVVDDRPQTVRMWRYELGLTTLQLNDIDF
jgi:predicted kinase